MIRMLALGVLFACIACSASSPQAGIPAAAAIDDEVRRLISGEDVAGVALAVIDDGEIVHLAAYGLRSRERGEPLTRDTILPAASFTKTAVAYLTLQQVDRRRLELDHPLSALADITTSPRYRDLAADPRWRAITPRHVLSHTTGFANFRWFEDDRRLRLHAGPGSRYGYSGEGFQLLQYVFESALQLDLGAALQGMFDRFGMTRSRMQWDAALGSNVADGYDEAGKLVPFDRRDAADAAGSLATTIDDQARLWAAMVRGDGLSAQSRAAFVTPQIAIRGRAQFPTLDPATDPRGPAIGLAAGLGVVVFDDPARGRMWFKGGHDDGTGNFALCEERARRCVVMLGNSVRAERIYPALVRFILGETAMPWWWEYRQP